MTPRERIVRLEGLLDRISKNVSRPRAPRAAVQPGAAPFVAAAPQPVVAAAPQPIVAEAPQPVAPPPPAPAAAAPPPPPSAAPAAPPPRAEVAAQAKSSVPPWKPEPSSTVQARPSTIPPEELSEDDLIDVTTVPPPDLLAAVAESGPADDIEEPPASSSRSKVVAESLDQAIASAAAQADDREVPIHTPPPESGPQEAVLPAGIEAPRAPEFGDLATDLVRPPSLGPTPEQLGETIELEGSEGPDIEIEVAGLPSPEPVRERPPEELEVTLPRAEMPSGTYDVDEEEAPPVALIPPPAVGVPEITLRPAVDAAEITHIVRVSEKAPEHFSELLDASLKL